MPITKRQRDNPSRLRFAASRGFLRALKCTYEIHCAAHKELSIFKSDRHVSQIPGHVPTRFGSEKPRDVLEKERERGTSQPHSTIRPHASFSFASCVLHTYINTPAYRSHTHDFEVALLAAVGGNLPSI